MHLEKRLLPRKLAKIGLFFLACVAITPAANSDAGVIDFELNAPTLFVNQVPLTNEYAGQGVLFGGQGEVLNMSTFSFGANSGTDALAFNAGVPVVGPQAAGFFDFAVDSVSFYAASSGLANISIQAFDGQGGLLGSTSQIVGGTYQQISLSGIGDIRSISIDSSSSVWAIDDLAFTESNNPVPEPTSIAVLAVAMCFGTHRRRRSPRA